MKNLENVARLSLKKKHYFKLAVKKHVIRTNFQDFSQTFMMKVFFLP